MTDSQAVFSGFKLSDADTPTLRTNCGLDSVMLVPESSGYPPLMTVLVGGCWQPDQQWLWRDVFRATQYGQSVFKVIHHALEPTHVNSRSGVRLFLFLRGQV